MTTEHIEIVTKAAGSVVVVGAALAVLYKFARAIYRAFRAIIDTYELVNHELTPNSGSSLYDAIKRIDTRVEVLESVDRRDNITRRDTDPGAQEHA